MIKHSKTYQPDNQNFVQTVGPLFTKKATSKFVQIEQLFKNESQLQGNMISIKESQANDELDTMNGMLGGKIFVAD